MPGTVHLHPVPSWTRVSEVNPPLQNRVEFAFRVHSLFYRLQREIGFDLIHQLNPVVLGMSSLLSGSGLPLVLGPLPAPGTGVLARTLGEKLRSALLRYQVSKAALLLVPSLASLPLVPPDQKSRAKVRELKYGIDAEQFYPAPILGQIRPSILFLANLVQRKGALLLMEAFELIAERHPECVLRIAGSGLEENLLRARAASSPVGNRIEFLGNVDRSQVADTMNAATLYCLPSYSEAFGMTALEAMACGKPVVGTRVGGLGFLLEGTPFLVEPGDRLGLASALDRALSLADQGRAAGDQNRRTVTEEYDWQPVIDRLELLYGEVTGL